jgi:hypothetical protein
MCRRFSYNMQEVLVICAWSCGAAVYLSCLRMLEWGLRECLERSKCKVSIRIHQQGTMIV